MYPYNIVLHLDRMADDGGTLPIAHIQSIVINHSQFDRHDVCLHTGEKKVIICVEKQEIHGGTIHRSILNSILQWRRANQNLVLSISRTFFLDWNVQPFSLYQRSYWLPSPRTRGGLFTHTHDCPSIRHRHVVLRESPLPDMSIAYPT